MLLDTAARFSRGARWDWHGVHGCGVLLILAEVVFVTFGVLGLDQRRMIISSTNTKLSQANKKKKMDLSDRYASMIKAMADDRVVFPGYVRDQDVLTELYCNAYAYVHGHEFGGTNPSLLKALANGCAVLALDTPFNREVLLGERHGFYFTKNEDDLVHLLSLVESNTDAVEEKRKVARNRIAEAYTWDGVISQYEGLFRKMAEGRK